MAILFGLTDHLTREFYSTTCVENPLHEIMVQGAIQGK